MKFGLVEVERFPSVIEPGSLYWSREFKMCAHRCACGCGDVIQLPVDELNYRIVERDSGVTLRPSVGNWGVCDAHYLITGGEVEWARKWSPEEIAIARAMEDARREAHFGPVPQRARRLRDLLARALGLLRKWFRH